MDIGVGSWRSWITALPILLLVSLPFDVHAQILNIQTAIDETPKGGTFILKSGTYAQGATPLIITAKSLHCQPGASITFSGLSSSTDAVTLGFSDDSTTMRTGLEGCMIDANASGRDIVRVNGGNHFSIVGNTLNNAGRDCIHIEPDSSSHWAENFLVNYNHCQLTSAASERLRDAINLSLATNNQTNVYINRGEFFGNNIRAYGQYAVHAYVNNNCKGCTISSMVFSSEFDSSGYAPSMNPQWYFEKGPSAGSNPFNAWTVINNDHEDTAQTPSGPIFKASGTRIGTGFTLIGFQNGNFPHVFDSNFVGDFTCVVTIYSDTPSMNGCPLQFWKDGTPTQAVSFGNMIPGGIVQNDALIAVFNAGAWSKRFSVIAEGGYTFANMMGMNIATINKSGRGAFSGGLDANGIGISNVGPLSGVTAINGSAPLSVYTTTGSPQRNSHFVRGSGILNSATPTSTATVTLSGSSIFASDDTYECLVSNRTSPARQLRVSYLDGLHFRVIGPANVADNFSFICLGN